MIYRSPYPDGTIPETMVTTHLLRLAEELAGKTALVDGTTGVLEGNILRAKALGNGVRMFNTSGKYRFRVNASFIRWHLKVIELTPEEAARYTPRQLR